MTVKKVEGILPTVIFSNRRSACLHNEKFSRLRWKSVKKLYLFFSGTSRVRMTFVLMAITNTEIYKGGIYLVQSETLLLARPT